MCERSNRPAVERTALCSASSEPYFSGMSQPPKSVKLAPSSSCCACSAVCLSAWVVSVISNSSLVFEGFRSRAGADQVAVATGAVDAAHGWEVLVELQGRYREGSLFDGVLAVPVAVDHCGDRVWCVAQWGFFDAVGTGEDLVHFLADGDHCFDEALDLAQVLGFGRLDHLGTCYREGQGWCVEAEVAQALGDIFSGDPGLGGQFAQIQDALVGSQVLVAGEQDREVLVQALGDVVGVQDRMLG